MATIFGTAGNDRWLVNVPGSYVFDGLGGVDQIDFGTSTLADYEITLGADGGVRVDTLSGASQQFHGTFYRFELFFFDSRRESIDLRSYFDATKPPLATLSDFTSGTATGTVHYELAFTKPVSGLEASDFDVAGGSIVSLAGSGSSYTLSVLPASGAEGSITLTLKAGAVLDANGFTNAAASAAPQPFDTLAPGLRSSSPAAGASGVAAGSAIVIEFSEAVVGGSGTIVLRDAAGSLLGFWSSSDVGVLLSGTRLELRPSAPLPAGSSVRVELGAAVVLDTAGNPFAATSFSFTTAAGVLLHSGGAGADRFVIGSGQHRVDGGGGIDTVQLASARSGYSLSATAGSFVLSAGDGSARIEATAVERLQFTDQRLALDLAGNAGIVAKIIGAVLGPASVREPALAGVGLQLVDAGTGYEALVQLALDFKLGAGATHAAVVDLLFGNVVGRAPSADERAHYVALLDNRTLTPAALGVMAAETELNHANVDFVGLSAQGLVYT